nr:membrane protein insertion efficiency factor YidD [Limnobacter humi]
MSLAARAISGLVRGYQIGISPMFAPSCRFYPSCSAYALEAVRMHGAWRGTALALGRVCRCNPWSAGGIDLVPGSTETDTHPAPTTHRHNA